MVRAADFVQASTRGQMSSAIDKSRYGWELGNGEWWHDGCKVVDFTKGENAE